MKKLIKILIFVLLVILMFFYFWNFAKKRELCSSEGELLTPKEVIFEEFLLEEDFESNEYINIIINHPLGLKANIFSCNTDDFFYDEEIERLIAIIDRNNIKYIDLVIDEKLYRMPIDIEGANFYFIYVSENNISCLYSRQMYVEFE